MRVAIHQPNYFPWMGFFNKLAKSELFILLDKVQLTDSGITNRNRILNKNGAVSYLTVSCNKKNHLQRNIADVEINNQIDWQKRQYDFLWDTYHKFPFWNEIYERISPIFTTEFKLLCDANILSIKIVCDILEIRTPIIRMSDLNQEFFHRKDELLIDLCKAVDADIYLSGNGARKYMDVSAFQKSKIQVQFQTFVQPYYFQKLAKEGTVLGLSILDVLFNCGIEDSRELFWSNLQSNEKTEANAEKE